KAAAAGRPPPLAWADDARPPVNVRTRRPVGREPAVADRLPHLRGALVLDLLRLPDGLLTHAGRGRVAAAGRGGRSRHAASPGAARRGSSPPGPVRLTPPKSREKTLARASGHPALRGTCL